jgi:hypothetical protein
MHRFAIDVRPGEYAVVRLAADIPLTALPPGLLDADPTALVSVTRTGDELSVVCPAALAPEAERVEAGWRLLAVRGPLEFTLTGITAALAGELAAAGVGLIGLSTFDTEYVLVKVEDLDRAVTALRASHHVTDVDADPAN